MASIYGHRWATNFGEDVENEAADTWAVGLADMTGAQLAQGLQACARSGPAWPPTLPEFRCMCLGVPTLAEVALALRPGAPEASPFVRLVWSFLDGYQLRGASDREARGMIRDAYELARASMLTGIALPEDALRLEHDPTAERMLYDRLHMQRLRELVAARATSTRDDESPETHCGNS